MSETTTNDTATNDTVEATVEAKPTTDLSVEAPVEAEPTTEPTTQPTTELTVEPAVEPTAYQRPAMMPGFEEVTTEWWDAVADVHTVLLSEDADLDRVSGAFNRELRARWEYARTLHERGYMVPEYLAERVPVAPLWPLPDLPVPARGIARAA